MPESPYSTKFASGEIDHELDPRGQMEKYKAEEKETHFAPNLLPYELSNLPVYFGEVIANAIEASKNIGDALKTKDIKNKKELETLKKNTDKMIVYLVKNVDSTLQKCTIGYGNEEE